MIISYRTEILLEDGTLEPVARLEGQKGLRGFAYIDKEFIPTDIQTEPVGEIKLYRLRTVTGRVLDIADDTDVYSMYGNWTPLSQVSHTALEKGTDMSAVNRPIAELGFLPLNGTHTQPSVWVDTVQRNLFLRGRLEEIPTYFSKLKYSTLKSVLQPFINPAGAAQEYGFPNVLSRNRWFHYLARLGSYSVESPNNGRRRGVFATSARPAYTPLMESVIKEYHDILRVPAFEVRSQHGNLLEKNFICRTLPLI